MKWIKRCAIFGAVVFLGVFIFERREDIRFSLWRVHVASLSDWDVLSYAERTGSLAGADLRWLRRRLSGNFYVIDGTEVGSLAEWTRTRDMEMFTVYNYAGTLFVIVTPTGNETISEVRYIKGF